MQDLQKELAAIDRILKDRAAKDEVLVHIRAALGIIADRLGSGDGIKVEPGQRPTAGTHPTTA